MTEFKFNGKTYAHKKSMQRAILKATVKNMIVLPTAVKDIKLKVPSKDRKEILTNKLNNSRKNFQVIEKTALKGKFKEMTMKQIPKNHKQSIKDSLLHEFLSNKQYRVNAFLALKYSMHDKDKEYTRFHNQKYKTLTSKKQIDDYVDTFYTTLSNSIEEAQSKSNLLKPEFDFFKINVHYGKSRKVGSYIKLPKLIELKRACINIKNNKDDKCLIWAMLAQKYYAGNPKKTKDSLLYYRQFEHEIKLPENLQFPIDVDQDIPEIEALNDIKINVFEYTEEDGITTLYNAGDKNNNVINVLLVHSDEKSHFVWIKDLSRLLYADTNVGNNKRFFCDNCLSASYTSQTALDNHQSYCLKNETCRAVFPKKGSGKDLLKFTNKSREFKHPFAVFADFESTLLDYEEKIGQNTERYQKHVANSFGTYYKCLHDEHSEEPFLYTNPDPEKVNEQFILKLEEYAKKSFALTKTYVNTKKFKDGEAAIHKACDKCMECNREFTKDNFKVLHHDHITGYYI